MRHYQRSVAMLQERLPESPLVSDLRDELESFLRERPSTCRGALTNTAARAPERTTETAK